MIESNTNTELEHKIDQYVEGKLNGEEVEELWSEVILDDYYYDYMKTVANLKGLANGQKAGRSIPQIGRHWYAAAAVLLIAVSLVLFNIQQDREFVLQPISSIELDYYRSADGMAAENDLSLIVMEIIAAANEGQVDQAIAIVERNLENLESDNHKAELSGTAGSVLYNAGRYQEAEGYFERAIALQPDDVLLAEQNYWYLGNTYFQLNKIEEARAALEKAYELNGAYSRIAQRYLQALNR